MAMIISQITDDSYTDFEPCFNCITGIVKARVVTGRSILLSAAFTRRLRALTKTTDKNTGIYECAHCQTLYFIKIKKRQQINTWYKCTANEG